MKMADGGYRPAYNRQISTVANGQIVVATYAETNGSDRGLMRPMLDEIERCYGRLPKRHWLTVASTITARPNWPRHKGSKSTGRRRRASTGPILMPRATMTVPVSPSGAGA